MVVSIDWGDPLCGCPHNLVGLHRPADFIKELLWKV